MKQARTEIDWLGFFLVSTMVTIVLWAMIAADWTDGLTTVWVVAVGGLVAGLALAASRFPSWVAHCFSIVYGLGWGSHWLGQLVEEGANYRERMLEIDRRIGVWLWQVTHNEVGRDSLIFILLLSALAWWLAYLAVWYSQRFNRVWRVVLPSGLALFANVYYAGSPLNVYLGFYLLTALLIVARTYTTNQEQHWKQNLVSYTTDFRFDLLRAGFGLALVALLVGWGVPAAASSEQAAEVWNRVQGPWRTVEDTWNRLFSSLRSRRPIYADPFGRFLTLKGARFVTEAPVMDVKSSEPGYWRATAFNQYTGSGWVTTGVRTLALDEYDRVYRYDALVPRDEPVPDDDARFGSIHRYGAYLRHPVTQTVTIYRPGTSIVFAASQPYRFSVPVRAEAWSPADVLVDPALIAAPKAFAPGASYVAVSLISHADVDSLRRAGENYPFLITNQFMGLPESLPQRVRALAQEIAAPYNNPYDQATAIEQWLRDNIQYDDQIASPPLNRDPVDYLLFESKRGYCDYYASAMAVMARAVGIPARVVVGYAQGHLDKERGVYRVLEKDAHSWVEIYFPRYGWIQFEPTVSQAPLSRPTPMPTQTRDSAANNTTNPPGTPPPRPLRDFDEPDDAEFDQTGARSTPYSQRISAWLVISLVAVGALLLLGAGVLIWTGFDSWSLSPTEVLLLVVSGKSRTSLHGLTAAQRAYSRLMRAAGWLKIMVSAHHTPHERGELFAVAVPEGRQAIGAIVDNYVREQYGREAAADTTSRQAWESVRAWIWRAGLQRRQEQAREFVRQSMAAFERFNSRFG